MARAYSPAQVYAYAVGAGFDPQTANIMTAIAGAESNFTPTSLNPCPGAGCATKDNSFGLWQINMYGDMGPSRRQEFGLTSNDQLFDPATNAKAAYRIYKSQGLDAWSTYSSGAYKQFLASTPSGGAPGAGVANTNPGASATPTAAQCRYPISIPLGITHWKFCADKLVGAPAMVGGFLILISGLVIMTKTSTPGKAGLGAAAGIVTAVTPVGKGAKLAAGGAKTVTPKARASRASDRNAEKLRSAPSDDLARARTRRTLDTEAARRRKSLPGINAGRSNSSIKTMNTRENRARAYAGSGKPASRSEAGF